MKKFTISFLKNIPFIISILFTLWILLGFFEVQIYNFNSNYIYSDWNFFLVFSHFKS